jgi:hypothetical protein
MLSLAAHDGDVVCEVDQVGERCSGEDHHEGEGEM